ncbi:hypothetical protein [Phenylobacterium montanum]|uniref:Uncharacterized protein n=1 Tax=Phenylobacterium montanum TaxID=2823693 RepID=A0A975FW50_9CAUL|nr:hypothetical protein [Caulobacter sp. S6]QUD86064.1 hypothetical protein KCG34_13210 [Caulobacter sp. S6]
MEALAELTDLGMELARELAWQGIDAAKAGEAKALEAERSFSRLTRSVRLTMALEARLSESLLPRAEAGKEREDGFWMPYSELNGAAQRLKEKLAKFIKNAPAPEDGDGEDDEEIEGEAAVGAEAPGGREREARERLTETEVDEEEWPEWLVSGGRAAEFGDGAGPLHRPAGEADASVGRSARRSPNHWRSDGSREAREPASHPPPPTGEELRRRGSEIIPPPVGEGDQPKAGGGGSPRASPFEPKPKAGGP